ncbi:RsiV family protein [Rhodococcus sp. IEGM 1381]|uniref:RsiV family protein n=1 Tax=Rhodococcus sp. IEGM 1381 TaxID=3047085 RepID=UPI0024B70503|nr:RsiV family protein [Rhodococcus sp. IEGM 1381]MDI9898172.1 RsiV family protein [Rhodococcus sp. IEGM 1381]
MTRIRSVAAALAVTAALAGCSTSGTATPASAPTTTDVTVTTERAEPTSTTPPTTSDAVEPYVVGSIRVTGSTDNATYEVAIPQLSAGNPAVTAEFNESMRAALQDQIDGDYGYDFALSDGYSTGATYVGRRVISAEQITDWIAVPPGAHGNSLLATVTINADTAQPISLGDAFSDLDSGLSRLSDQAAKILPTTRAGESFERSGIEPTVANFANWTASPEGMNIHFGDYQVGAYGIGLITITVPWTDLSDVLAPGMQEVLSS